MHHIHQFKIFWQDAEWAAKKSALNSLTPGRCGSNYKSVTSEYMSQIKFMSISCEIALRWRQ